WMDASSRAHLRSVIAPAVASAGHSAGMTDGGSGHADTTNSGPTRAASQANLRDHVVVRLRNWRCWHHCLRRRCEGQEASNSYQLDHSSPPLFTVSGEPLSLLGLKRSKLLRATQPAFIFTTWGTATHCPRIRFQLPPWGVPCAK